MSGISDGGVGGMPAGRDAPLAAWPRRAVLRGALGLGAMALLPGLALAGDIVDRYPWMAPWVREDGMDRAWLNALFAEMIPYPRAVRSMNNQAEAKPYYHYRNLFINDRVIRTGQAMYQRHRQAVHQIRERFGVPPAVQVALWGIESRYGASTGRHPVLRTLFTLATGYPRRAPFFQEQLRQFLLLCREEGWDPGALKGSYAGAMSQAQMIPGTMRRYAVDFNQDGKRDVFNDPVDVLASIAHFLEGHGWQRAGLYAVAARLPVGADPAALVTPGLDEMRPWRQWQGEGITLAPGASMPEPDAEAGLIMLEWEDGPRYHMVFNNFRVVTRWNNSRRFAMVVGELAAALERGNGAA